MKKFLLLAVLIAVLCVVYSKVPKDQLVTLVGKENVEKVTQSKTYLTVSRFCRQTIRKGKSAVKNGFDKKKKDSPSTSVTKSNASSITLYLKNGGAITGDLVQKTDKGYHILWAGQSTYFAHAEIERVSSEDSVESNDGIFVAAKEDDDGAWTYTHDVVVQLMNGEVLDASINMVTEERVICRQTFEEGGYVEQEVAREKVDAVLFKPVENEQSAEIRTMLEGLFPDMTVYDDGNVTILSDSYVTRVNLYKKLLRRHQTEIYLQFFDLFKDKKSTLQNFIVIFDNPEAYMEYAASDGVPGWLAPGYYSPDTHVLYLFNMAGDSMETYVNGFMESLFGTQKQLDAALDTHVQERYQVFVKGQIQGVKNKFWKYVDWYMSGLRNTTEMILRHEFAHEMLSNWGLVAVTVSRLSDEAKEEAKKKKKFLQAETDAAKEKALAELMHSRSDDEVPDVKVANSWLAEGTATFCETEMLGQENNERLYAFQKMMRNNLFMPLEQLTVYKIGSFPGVCNEVMLYAYAESWALVTYLMHHYPAQFMQYMQRVAEKEPEGNEDVLWLEETIGKDRRTMEEELQAFMKTFPEVVDPFMEFIDKRDELKNSLMSFGDV